jgi:phytoene dehydrogenase-like protein
MAGIFLALLVVMSFLLAANTMVI